MLQCHFYVVNLMNIQLHSFVINICPDHDVSGKRVTSTHLNRLFFVRNVSVKSTIILNVTMGIQSKIIIMTCTEQCEVFFFFTCYCHKNKEVRAKGITAFIISLS